MMNEIRLTAINDVGTKALRQMIDDDEKESTYRKNKVSKEWELKILSENPLTYSAKIKPQMLTTLEINAKRIGHIVNVSVDTMVDTLVSTAKSHAISRMQRNGALKGTDYKIRILSDDEDE